MSKRVLIIIGVILLLIVGIFGFTQYARIQSGRAAAANIQTSPVKRGSLVAQIGATGTVRANQSGQLAWQVSGTVGDVKVKVGDKVSSGQELASLVQPSLPQNILLAQADYVTAKKALDDLMNSNLQEAQAQQAVQDAQKALDDLKQSTLTQAQAEKAVADAQKAVQDAEIRLRNIQSPADTSTIQEAQAQVMTAKINLDNAQEAYKPFANKSEDSLHKAELLSRLAKAQQQYDAAVRNLNALQGVAGSTDQAIAQANLEQAKAQLADARRNLDQVKNGPSTGDLAAAEAKLADAQRNWERVKDGPNPDDIEAAKARVAAAEATLNMGHITAPFSGVITEVDAQPGDQVNPNTPAFRLDDLSRHLVDVQVSEVDINSVQTGQPVTLTFDSVPNKEYHGKVSEVSSVGTTDQGVVNFNVTVDMIDADQQVKPGMTAAVSIISSELKNVLLVPNRAVRTNNGQQVVYVLRNNTPTPVNVTLGKSSDTESELVSGDLKEGDPIVLNPPINLFQQGGRPGGGFGGGGGGQDTGGAGGQATPSAGNP